MLSCCAREQYLLVSGPTSQVVYMCLQNTTASPSNSYPKHQWGRNATQEAYPKHLWRLNATQERVAHTVPLRLQRPSPWHRLVPGRQWPKPVPHLPFCHGKQPIGCARQRIARRLRLRLRARLLALARGFRRARHVSGIALSLFGRTRAARSRLVDVNHS